MTAARLVARKEVERVYASLERAFEVECPEHAEMARLDLVLVPPPPRKTRAFALWEAFRLVWSARARFLRRETTARAKKHGQRMPLHDDKLRDKAIRNVERAIAYANNAAELLDEDASGMEAIAKQLRGGRVEGPREDADAASKKSRPLRESRLRRFGSGFAAENCRVCAPAVAGWFGAMRLRCSSLAM